MATAGSPLIGVEIETNVDGAAALDVLKAGVTLGLREVFEGRILPDAKARCPVEADPIKPGSTHNRDSLRVMVWISPKGPMGKLASTSGHGGFVEVGTAHMSAQPYAWPAVQTNLTAITEAIKDHLAKGEVQLGRVMPVE
jgi:hypothetical protein